MFKSTYGTMYYVDDMAQAISFYKSQLGLQPSYESAAWTEFSLSGHNLCLHAKEAGKSYPANGVMIMNAEGVKTLFEQMKRENINVYGLHEVHPGAWSFHLKDQFNNELSIYGAP